MGESSAWRESYLKRQKLRAAGLALAGLLILLVAAEGLLSWQLTSSTQDPASLSSEGGVANSSSEDSGGEKPYEAIPPPENAEAETSGPGGDALAGGAEDGSDGPLKDNRLVTFYGHPYSDQMGILGELAPEQMMRELEAQTRAYSAADPGRPAVPTIELIASVAQRDPGPQGLHVTQTPEKEIREYSRLAERNDALLLLDVQLGRDDLMREVERLEPFLKQEHVHLAIDTEYSVGEGQVPGVDLGTVAGSEVQEAVRYMDRLVEEEGIPDKLVLVHQFETGIVTGKQDIEPTNNVQVALNADGFGQPAAKLAKYDELVRQQPIQYGGFKLFYNQDYPLLTPAEALDQSPSPTVINYQ